MARALLPQLVLGAPTLQAPVGLAECRHLQKQVRASSQSQHCVHTQEANNDRGCCLGQLAKLVQMLPMGPTNNILRVSAHVQELFMYSVHKSL